jgi:hypothetical protein
MKKNINKKYKDICADDRKKSNEIFTDKLIKVVIFLHTSVSILTIYSYN